jgi:hypothetical protein
VILGVTQTPGPIEFFTFAFLLQALRLLDKIKAPRPSSKSVAGSGTISTVKLPMLLNHSQPSIVPKNILVAPEGAIICCLVPELVSPSPIKNGCLRSGSKVK